MAGAATTSGIWRRRVLLGVALLPLGVARAWSQQTILIVSRKRLLNETRPARDLLRAEIDLTAELQRRVDAVKAQLTAEEEKLARIRPSMDRKAFEARVAEFDRTVRRVRRQTQRRAASLQNAFREARLQFVDALGPVLEEVRIARGAEIILNAEQVLVSDPAVDVTDEVIRRIDATIPTPPIPELESLDAGPDDTSEDSAPAAGSGESLPQ